MKTSCEVVASKRTQDKVDKAAAWLCDNFGKDGEDIPDWRRDARDFIAFMKANGWEFRPTVMIIHERPPF
jgi:hypothetical protein